LGVRGLLPCFDPCLELFPLRRAPPPPVREQALRSRSPSFPPRGNRTSQSRRRSLSDLWMQDRRGRSVRAVSACLAVRIDPTLISASLSRPRTTHPVFDDKRRPPQLLCRESLRHLSKRRLHPTAAATLEEYIGRKGAELPITAPLFRRAKRGPGGIPSRAGFGAALGDG
jgi:hypothetical protein